MSSGGSSAPPQSGKMTALEAHVAFFDRDNDGIIWPMDTYIGCRLLKFSIFLAILNTILTHLAMSYITWNHIIPDPFFRIRVNRIHKAKHGSDTEAYTHRGDFDPNRFDYFFDIYSDPPHTHITPWQIVKMVLANFLPFDPFGQLSQVGEWTAAYVLLGGLDPRGLAREDVKGLYNGSTFYKIAGIKPPTR